MSTSTFESNIKQIPHKQESVFNTLSDLNNLQVLKDRFEQVKDQIPEDKRKEMEKLKDLRFDSDSITINAPMVGDLKMRIIDRDFQKPSSLKQRTALSHSISGFSCSLQENFLAR